MQFHARVYITPRRDVLDPQGQAVARALSSMGFGGVGDVRLGRYIEVSVDANDEDAARAELASMCDKLLANPVVEDYRFDLEAGA